MNIKKIIFFFFILLSTFFVTDKVSAAKLKYNYNSSDFEILNEYKYVIDDIISYANENNSNNYTYFIYLVKSSGNYYLCFGLGNYTSSVLKFQPYYYTGSPRYYYNGANQILVLNNDDYSVIGTSYSNNVSFNLSDFNSEDYDTFINTVQSYILNGATSRSYLSNQVATTPVNVDYFSNSNYLLPVYSSSKLQYYQAYTQYTDTITIGDITYNYGDYIPTYYEYFQLDKPKTPTIDFNLVNNEIIHINSSDTYYVVGKRLDIIFSDFDVEKYTYMYAINDTNNFQTITSTKNKKFSFNITENCVIYAKIIDNLTGELVYTSALTVEGITKPIPKASLNLLEEIHYDNDLSKPILYKTYELSFDYFNTEKFDYHYYDNYLNISNYLTENNYKIYAWDNYAIPVQIYDHYTGEIVSEYTFYSTGITGSDVPIAFFDITDVPLYCGEEDFISAKEVYIDFSFVNTGDFIYQYRVVTDDDSTTTDWISELRYNGDFFIRLDYNATIFVRVLDKHTNEFLYGNSLTITGIDSNYDDVKCYFGDSYNDNIRAVQKFLKELTNTRNQFHKIFYAFFDNLPEFIQLGLVTGYIISLIILAFKLGGWK